MSHTSLIKIGRIFEGFDSAPSGTTFYQRGALKLARDFLHVDHDAPVVINHDWDRQIGVVRELSEFRDTDGVWLAALTTITNPPDWLKCGTRASFCFKALDRQQLGDSERILRGWVEEVSVLSPDVRPKEPAAQVLTLSRDQDSSVAERPDRRSATDEVVLCHPPVVRRRRPQARFFTDEEISDRLARAAETGVPGAFELELEHMKRLEKAALEGRLPLVL